MSLSDDGVVTAEIQRLRRALETHAVFDAIDGIDALRRFMQVHVFAVWDFMSLAKRLQRDLTCVELPWMPPADAHAARVINEIVLGEESDVGPDGEPASHLTLYLAAMREAGAPTAQFDAFLDGLRAGYAPRDAMREVEAPACVIEFVTHTLGTVFHGTTLEVLASFLYGRENVIPAMFEALLARWQLEPESVPWFTYYLRRHIELDGDSHGPAAARVIAAEVAHSPRRVGEARAAARASLLARRRLWDGTLALLNRDRAAAPCVPAAALA